METATHLRINLLGRLTASFDDRLIDLGGRRQRAVLAVLLLARGEIVPADSLVEAVWGEHAARTAIGALQSYVSHLRRSLQPDAPARGRSAVIAREGPGYCVRLPADAVDTWRFEALLGAAETVTRVEDSAALLREALDLWAGPALAEYADEPWAAADVARLGELRLVARERLLAARLDLEEPGLLVPELEAMVAEDPLREERWRLLALALYRAQRQADALAALRRARTRLADELGVDPGPALRELEAAVLAQAPSLLVPRRTDPEAAPRPPHRPAGLPAGPARDPGPLVERDREVAALTGALDDLVTRHGGGLVLVQGSPGIGKTRLLQEAERLAEARGVQPLRSRATQLETAYAFGVVRQLLEPELGDGQRRTGLLEGVAGAARGVFDLEEEGRADGFAVLHGLHRLVATLAAEGPLLLCVDDAQWCDAASLRFLAYVGRRLRGLPVLLVVAVRTGGDELRQEAPLAELSLEPEAVVLRPDALSSEATAELVARTLATAPAALFNQACHRTTAGNPLLLSQLLRALAADGVRPDAAHADRVVAVGSRAVSSTVLARLRGLPEHVVEVARAVAVLGDGPTLPVVARLAGLSEESTAEGWSALTRAQVLSDDLPLAFVHPIVREAIHQSLPTVERGRWHERAAATLRSLHASDEQVAAHLLLAPPRADDGVVGLLRAAAQSASDRGAPESAVTYLRRALAEDPRASWRPEVLLQLGLLEAGFDGAAGAEHLEEAYHLHPDPRVRADIALVAAATHVFASPPGFATTFARRAESALPCDRDDLDDHRQGLVALQRMSGFLHALDEGWRTPALPPEGPGPGAQMVAATIALEALVEGVDRARAVAMARFTLEGDRLLAVDDGLFWVNAAAVRTLSDDPLGDFWARARGIARARGSLFATLSINLWEGFWRWQRGELHEALACLRDALEQDRMWGGTGLGEPLARGFQIGCHLDRATCPRRARSPTACPRTSPSARADASSSRRWPACWSRRADPTRRSPPSTPPRRASGSATPPGTPGERSARAPSTDWGARPRRSPWPRNRSTCCADGALPAIWAVDSACSAACAGTTAWMTCARRCGCSPRPTPRSR